MSGLDGILLVDKPAGVTSAGVVREVKRRLGARKVGHLGTLDPFATGLLPICLGEGAKVVPYLNQEDKAYRGTLRLGTATDTLDSTGRVVETLPVPALTAAAVEAAAARFLGAVRQVPPMYSAVKRDGVPLYRLARRGVEVEREAREVRIHCFETRLAGADEIAFEVRCSKGTYVRVLAADLARALGTVGHLSSLRRTAFGPFRVEQALPPERIAAGAGLPLVSPREALAGVAEVDVDAGSAAALRFGRQSALAALPPPRPGRELAKLVGPAGELVAIVGEAGRTWKLLRVFGGG